MSRICRSMGTSRKSLFHQLEHESKMRLHKTHSHTSEWRGYWNDANQPFPTHCARSPNSPLVTRYGCITGRHHPSRHEDGHGPHDPQGQHSLNWTGPYEVLAVGACTPTDIPDGSPLDAKLLYLDLPSDMPGADARRHVSVQRCKPCANPHDHGDMQKCMPAE